MKLEIIFNVVVFLKNSQLANTKMCKRSYEFHSYNNYTKTTFLNFYGDLYFHIHFGSLRVFAFNKCVLFHMLHIENCPA